MLSQTELTSLLQEYKSLQPSVNPTSAKRKAYEWVVNQIEMELAGMVGENLQQRLESAIAANKELLDTPLSQEDQARLQARREIFLAFQAKLQ